MNLAIYALSSFLMSAQKKSPKLKGITDALFGLSWEMILVIAFVFIVLGMFFMSYFVPSIGKWINPFHGATVDLFNR